MGLTGSRGLTGLIGFIGVSLWVYRVYVKGLGFRLQGYGSGAQGVGLRV